MGIETAVGPKKRPIKKILIAAAVLTLAALVVGLNIYQYRFGDAISVQTTRVKQKKLVDTVLASGKVYTPDKEIIYSQVTGTVKKIHVHLGQTVEPGQLLMELDIPDAENRLHQAQSTLAAAEAELMRAQAGGQSQRLMEARTSLVQAENNWKIARDKLARCETLFQQGAVSQEELDKASAEARISEVLYQKALVELKAAEGSSAAEIKSLQASVEAARSNLELVRRQTAQSGLMASRKGQVMSIGVNPGDIVTAGTQLVTIGNIENLLIQADITEADVSRVKVGQRVKITAAAIPDASYYGRVKEIGLEAVSKVKQSNQSEASAIPVTVTVDKGTGLRPGYNVDLEITASVNDKALVVPYESLIVKGGKTSVYLIRNGKALLKRVSIGISDDLMVEVKSGLKKGDIVVTNPPKELKHGSKVLIR